MSIRISGLVPPDDPKIKDLVVGQTGYTVPWAYDKDTGNLNTDFTVGDKGGTASLRVTCVGLDDYEIEFEEPVYRKLW